MSYKYTWRTVEIDSTQKRISVAFTGIKRLAQFKAEKLSKDGRNFIIEKVINHNGLIIDHKTYGEAKIFAYQNPDYTSFNSVILNGGEYPSQKRGFITASPSREYVENIVGIASHNLLSDSLYLLKQLGDYFIKEDSDDSLKGCLINKRFGIYYAEFSGMAHFFDENGWEFDACNLGDGYDDVIEEEKKFFTNVDSEVELRSYLEDLGMSNEVPCLSFDDEYRYRHVEELSDEEYEKAGLEYSEYHQFGGIWYGWSR